MRRIAASTLMASICDRSGWDYAELDADEFAAVRRALSQALAEIYETTWWRDLMRTERRTFVDPWDAAETYAAADTVYHHGSEAYYVALRASTNEEPAAADGAGGWDVNLAYWAEAVVSPDGEDYDSATAYVAGDIVRNPDDGLVYQCHTASTGNAPTNTSYWGGLAAFRPLVPWDQVGQNRIGRVKLVSQSDPRVALGPGPCVWQPVEDGVQLPNLDVPRPWVQFRLPAPRLTGDSWDSGEAYTAVPSDETGQILTVSDEAAVLAIQGRAALRALVRHEPNELRYLAYLVTAGDGQGGEFVFGATETTADDGVDYLKPDNVDSGDPGRWVRQVNTQ